MHYLQNFNVLATATNNSTATSTWSDNSTIPGCFIYRAGNGATVPGFAGPGFGYRVSDGSVNLGTVVGNLFSMGAAGAPDRAMAVPSTTSIGEISSVFVFRNNTSSTAVLTNIRYTVDILRTNNTSGVTETIFFWYRTGNSEAEVLNMVTSPATATVFPPAVSTSPTSNYVSGWTQVPQANFTYTAPVADVPTNVSTLINVNPPSSITVNPGQFIAIRWANINDSGQDALMGIDDVDLNFVTSGVMLTPEVSTVSRSTAGTIRNPADDTVSFHLTVEGTGAVSPSGWVISSPASLAGQGAAYGGTLTGASLPISAFNGPGHTASITVRDSALSSSTATATVTAPWCSLSSLTANSFVYDDGGTPTLPSDDTVTCALIAYGSFTSAQFGVQGVTGAANYTAGLPVGPFPAGSSQVFVFYDAGEPSCTASLKVTMPSSIGVNRVSGVESSILSQGIAGSPAWTFDAAGRTMELTSEGLLTTPQRVVLSQPVDLTAAGTAFFSATLRAHETSNTSNFERPDVFKIELILDGGTPGEQIVNLVTPYDTGDGSPSTEGSGLNGPPDGWINGYYNTSANDYDANRGRDEFNRSALTVANDVNETFTFHYTIPAAVNHAQVRITAVLEGISLTERFTVSEMSISTGVPGRYVIGRQSYGGSMEPLTAPVMEPEWANDPELRTLTFANAGTARDRGVSSQVIDLSARGTVYFSGLLRARETSMASNFETADRFRAELVLDGTTVVNLIAAYDAGDGSSGVSGAPNGPPNGYLNGYEGTAGGGFPTALLEYNARKARDELNLPQTNGNALLDVKIPLAYTIPAAVNSAKLRVYAAGTDATESFTLQDVLFTTAGAATDSDADGVPDLTEIAQGTHPADVLSLFKIEHITPHPTLPGVTNAHFPTVPGRLYRGYYSADLTTWLRDDGHAVVTGSGSPAAWPLVPFGQRRYMKIVIGRESQDFPAALP